MELSAAGISAFKAQQVQEQVGLAVMKKSLDAAEQQGQAAIQLIDAAAQVAEATAPNTSSKGLDIIA
ncbi:MAG: YjfB family protein [Phycisphaerae bacterium]